MPHGGGSFGGGGGGGGYRGGGGGGYHGGYRHHGSGRRGRCSPGCCCFFLISAAVLPFLLTPIVMVYGVYKPTTLEISPRGTRLFQLNTAWNRAIGMYTDSADTVDARAYLFDKRPRVLDDQDSFTIEANTSVKRDNYEYYSFYLIPPSNATFQVTARDQFDFYLIKGQSKFDQFTKSGNEGNKSIAGYRFKPVRGQPQTVTVFNASIAKEDVYFFTISRLGSSGATYGKMNLSLSITRSLYDVKNSTNLLSCNLSYSGDKCSQDLPYGSERILVFVGPDNPDMSFSYSPSYEYTARGALYVAVFLGTPVGLVVALVVIVMLCRRRRSSVRRITVNASSATSERAPLNNPPSYPAQAPTPSAPVASLSPPSYPAAAVATAPPQSSMDAPPSYASLIRTDAKKP